MTEQMEKKMRNELYGWHIGEDNPAISGIEWYLNNLWHDASEKPDGKRYVICYDGKYASVGHFNEVVRCKWCYIEDLLSGDLTGIKEGGKNEMSV